jgi:hypothetical protein
MTETELILLAALLAAWGIALAVYLPAIRVELPKDRPLWQVTTRDEDDAA